MFSPASGGGKHTTISLQSIAEKRPKRRRRGDGKQALRRSNLSEGRQFIMRTLKDLAVGQSGHVKTVGGEKALRRRLLDMGITPRTVVTIKKTAPMGDPIELLLRGYVLTIRLEDAEKIEIEEVTA